MYTLKFFLALLVFFLVQQPSDSAAVVSGEPVPVTSKVPLQNFEINTYESRLQWTGKALTGGEYEGTIDVHSGAMTTEDGQVKNAKLTIDMNSIKSTGINDEKVSWQVEGLLKSDAFFSVRNFPVSYFTMTKIIPGKKKHELMVTGNLVINGVTNEISFPAVIEEQGDKMHLNAAVTFDRTRWGITYKSLNFFSKVGSGLIASDITLKLALVFDEAMPGGC